MTTQERMIKRLGELLAPHGITLPEGTELHRTHAGRVQRSQGAWSWFAWHPDLRPSVGSHYPMSELLRCKDLQVSYSDHTQDWSVDPVHQAEQVQCVRRRYTL